jgi:phosphotransferase system  glucose/maltose/N-acetylglucosamine-specific IIC component
VETETAAWLLIIGGALMAVLGVGVLLLARAGFSGFPGDISFKGDNFSVYIPIVSMIVASVVLTIVVNVAIRLFNR